MVCSAPPYVLYIEKEFLYVPGKKKMVDTIEKQNLFWDTLIKASLFQTKKKMVDTIEKQNLFWDTLI